MKNPLIPESADDFIMLRRGLLDHIIQGKLNSTEFNVYIYLLLKSNRKTGMLHSNATVVSSEARMPLKTAQHALYGLREKKYIHYADSRGVRGAHEIYINKYPVQITKREWQDSPVWYSSIWNQDGSFIGHDYFFGRIKVQNLASFWHICKGICRGISIQGFGLSSDFILDFKADFKEYQKTIEILSTCEAFCLWLLDFEGDFAEDFGGTFKGRAYYIQILPYTSILKEQVSQKIETEIHDLCKQLDTLNHGFNPYAAVNKSRKSKIPENVIRDVLLSMDRKIQRQEPIEDGYKYYFGSIKNSSNRHHYEDQLVKHEEFKRFDPKTIGKVTIIDD